MPTKGTINCAVGGRRRISSINSNIPAIAAAAATDILVISAAAGKNKAIISKPKAALWLAPTIDGSTKRLRIRICIIMPATASEAPVSTMAKVRGRRLVSINCISSEKCSSLDQLKSATPMERLAANSSISAARFRVRKGKVFCGM